MPELVITGWTALICGVLYLTLTASVIRYRRSEKIALGDGGDTLMLRRIRGQANAAEQIPITLFLLALCEYGGAYFTINIGIALLLVSGRALHAVPFLGEGRPWQFRVGGMALTLTAQILALVTLFVLLIS